jgi:hypothetical protein
MAASCHILDGSAGPLTVARPVLKADANSDCAQRKHCAIVAEAAPHLEDRTSVVIRQFVHHLLQPIREQLPTFIVTLDFLQRRRNATTERVDQSAD